MSGGTFEYAECRINEIIADIQERLDRQGKRKSDDDFYDGSELTYETYPPKVQQRMKEAVKALQVAFAYAHAVDYYLAGDTGDESFEEEITRELEELK